MLVSPSSAQSVRVRTRLPNAQTRTSVGDATSLAILQDCRNAWGTVPHPPPAPGPHAPHPPAPSSLAPEPPVPASHPPAPTPDPPTPIPSTSSVSEAPAASSVDAGVIQPPPSLMSLEILPPHQHVVQSGNSMEFSQGESASSQVPLFSASSESVEEFSEEMSPAPLISPSPSISSFSSSADNSQSILKDVAIVSSGPAAEQIANNNGAPIVSSGPAAEQIANSNGTPIVSSGPSVAEQIASSNVAKANRSKVSNGSTSKDAKQPEPTLLQLSQSGSPKSSNSCSWSICGVKFLAALYCASSRSVIPLFGYFACMPQIVTLLVTSSLMVSQTPLTLRFLQSCVGISTRSSTMPSIVLAPLLRTRRGRVPPL